MRQSSLPRVRGRDVFRRFARRQERPTERPHKGRALHLHDKVRVNIHINICTINNDGLLVANADNITKAFGGRVALG